MSKRYTADGRRLSSMTHAQRAYHCSCGKVVHGNGGKSSHARACPHGYWLSSMAVYEQRRDAYDLALGLVRLWGG